MGSTKFKDLPATSLSGGGAFGYRLPRNAGIKFLEYFNLLANQLSIYRTDTGKRLNAPDEFFALTCLITAGRVGFDKIANQFFYVFGEGINELRLPVWLDFVTGNGKSYRRRASYDDDPIGAYIIFAQKMPYSLAAMIQEHTDFMEMCEQAKWQNADACKTPYIIQVKDKEMELSVKQALQRKQTGQAVIVVSSDLGDALKAVNIGVEFLADKFDELEDYEDAKLRRKLGILTSNEDKRERVQSAEVNAGIGQCLDNINVLIDTFNQQMETYAIPLEMRFNGSIEDVYLDGSNDEQEGSQPMDANEVEDKGRIKQNGITA